MCGGGTPSVPELPPAPPPAPAPPPMPEPAAALPAPVSASAGEGDAAKVQKRTSKRAALQQSSSGADALRIPLDAASTNVPTNGTGPKKGSLNIPK